MTDAQPPDQLVPEAKAFLNALKQNNNREWFLANKTTYDAALKGPALAVLDAVAPELEALCGAPVKTKLFRANRDVRFSKDKTPYHVHLHMLWSLPDGRGWFFGIAPDYVTAGAGAMGFDKAQLEAWRTAVSGDQGAELSTLLGTLGARVDPAELKRVPSGFSPDHPQAGLLKRKSMSVWLDSMQDALTKDPVPGLRQAFTQLQPLQDWLGKALSP